MAEVISTAAKAIAGWLWRHLGHGKLSSIPPPPSAMLARISGTLRSLLGPVATLRMVETEFKLNPTRNSYDASQG